MFIPKTNLNLFLLTRYFKEGIIMLKMLKKKIAGKSLALNSFINLSTKISLLFISLAFIGYISRILDQTELGIFAVLFIFYSLLGMLGGLGLNSTALRLIPELLAKKEHTKTGDIIKITMIASTFATLLLCLAGFGIDTYIASIFLKSKDLAVFIDWIIVNSFFYTIFDRFILLYQTLQQFKMLAFLNIITNVSQRAFALILILLGYKLHGIMLGFLLGTLLGVICGFIGMSKFLFSQYNGYSAKEYIKFSFPFYGQGIMRFMFSQADQMLIAFLFNPEKLAIYFIAKKIINLITLVFEAIYDTVTPKLAEIKSKGLLVFKNNLGRVYQILISLVLIGVSVIFLNSKLFMFLLGGEKFTEYYYLLNVLAISIITYTLYLLSNIGVYLYKSPKEGFALSFYVGATTVILEIIFGLTFGLIGFSIAQSIGYIVGIAIVQYKYKDASINYIWRRDITFASLAALGLITGYYINTYFLTMDNTIFLLTKTLIINILLLVGVAAFYFKKEKMLNWDNANGT
ncbi:MAG TPA: hypothetical protein DF296_01890 [Candidatus Margulisbacteria bacterium]|nr:hypothetical protein [Candidatus Margulisiibacteriota bacterium]HCT83928.1 hypothetical protein [Candidatus Margulisiibacteriota bacterium]